MLGPPPLDGATLYGFNTIWLYYVLNYCNYYWFGLAFAGKML